MTPKKTDTPKPRKKMSQAPIEEELAFRLDKLIQRMSPAIRNRTHFMAVYIPQLIEQLEKELKEKEEGK